MPLFLTVAFLAGLRVRAAGVLMVLLAMVGGLGWHFALKDYQKARIYTFLDPSLDPKGAGYQKIQSQIAVGSGGLAGKGYRSGGRSQLGYLPARQTDFIFSVLAEEMGFLGVMVVLGLYLLVLWRAWRPPRSRADRVGAFLAAGIAAILSFQVVYNVAMVAGLVPVKGLPLPLMSWRFLRPLISSGRRPHTERPDAPLRQLMGTSPIPDVLVFGRSKPARPAFPTTISAAFPPPSLNLHRNARGAPGAPGPVTPDAGSAGRTRPGRRAPRGRERGGGSRGRGTSMTKDIIVSSTPQETRVALLEDGVVAELFIEREAHRGIVGNIYKGRVTRVLPGMQSAFVDLGLERDAFLYVADVFEELPENLLTAEETSAARSARSRTGSTRDRRSWSRS